MNHYRCVRYYFSLTRSERDVDTVNYFPTVVPFPEGRTEDLLNQAALDIISILTAQKNLLLEGLVIWCKKCTHGARKVSISVRKVIDGVKKVRVTWCHEGGRWCHNIIR